MRVFLVATLALATAAPAVAHPTHEGRNADRGDRADEAKQKTRPDARNSDKKRRGKDSRPVAFVVRGVVTAVDTAAQPGTITVTVWRANGHARRALRTADTKTVVVKVGDKTRITKRGIGRTTLDQIAVGDRVVVKWKTPRRTALDALPEAKRVVDVGPKRTPKPKPDDSETPTPEVPPAL